MAERRAEFPILYSFRRCPYAMRARMAIGVAGLEVEHREILLGDRPEELRQVSELATVPCLQLATGEVLPESLEIMSWTLAQSDPAKWLPGADESQAVDTLIARNDGEFKHHLDRFKYATRYEDADPLRSRTEAERILADLDTRLREHQQLLGDRVSIADVAIFPFVRQFSRADPDWFATTPYQALRRWLDWWEASSWYRRIMAKIPVWQAGDPVLRFTAAFPVPESIDRP